MPGKAENRFLLLYGSQTGQAKAIAEELAERAIDYGLQPDLHCLSLTEKKFFIEREKCVVFIISTTGDGEPPETALKFVRRLRKKTLLNDYLDNLSYTLLGLGDSNYTSFCNCGKSLDRRLQELGAHRFYDCGWADDAVGLEVVVEAWIDGLWVALKEFLKLPEIHPSTDTDSFCDSPSIFNENCDIYLETKKNTVSDKVKVENSVTSLCWSKSPLSESTLTVPQLMKPFLKLQYHMDRSVDVHELPLQNGAALPSAATPVTMATVTKIENLTSNSAVKTSLLVELDILESELSYEPGDNISVIPQNNQDEVDMLLTRLECVEMADKCVEISVLEDSKKKVPDFIPKTATLRHLFKTCIDIRASPKKALLRALVEYTEDEDEKRRLQELCSKQGADDYKKFVLEPSLSILDILNVFTSCHPPVEKVIEHLTRLQPRPYSVCCSSRIKPGRLQFCLTVVEILPLSGRTYYRKGVCSGWLEDLAKSIKLVKQTEEDQNVEIIGLEDLHIGQHKIPVFRRTHQNFRQPKDITIPLILIGPGTGVAPFIGFLEERAALLENHSKEQQGEIWLFYGCRHKERDFLFREQMEQYLSLGTLTKLLVSFSRDDQPAQTPRYVQDSLRTQGENIIRLIEKEGAMVYVCGDADQMSRDVNQAFIEIFAEIKGLTMEEGSKMMMQLRLEHRYREDVWT